MLGAIPGLTMDNRFSMQCPDEFNQKRNVSHCSFLLSYLAMYDYIDRWMEIWTLAMDKEKEPQYVMSWLLKAMDEKNPSAPPSEQSVEEDARLLIITGSDTSAGVLSNGLYLLANNPHCCF
ncbi:hypothetical protein CCMA1212_008236 [Trichoderma ghanense]|uniref:Cytochrome P450 monooxygenase n=1 Tax=Trichoderma ghanense TaxID=65468 RepID=A0ABY2GWY8_9HYPO